MSSSENETRRSSRTYMAIALVVVLVIAGVVYGYTKSSHSSASSKGGTLNFITNQTQFQHVDPARVYTGRDIAFFNSYLYRNLVSYKPAPGATGASLVPDLATDIGIPSNNAKTWTFTLRSGITWQDGSPVTCADELYGVSRPFATDVITDGPQYLVGALDIPVLKDGSSAYKGPYKKVGQALFDKAVTCSGNVITFHLNRPFADFNYALTYPAGSPVKQSMDTGDKYDLKPFSNGPYMISTYKTGAVMDLVRNPKWNQSSDTVRTPHATEITVRFGLSQDVADQVMLDNSTPNTVDLDALQPANLRSFFSDASKAGQRLNTYDPYVRYAAMNVSPGHLDCLNIRKAVFFANNAQGLIDLAGGTTFYGVPGDSPVKPVLGLDYAATTGNIHDPLYKVGGNPTKAKELMALAKVSCPAAYDRATNPNKGIFYDLPNTATQQKAAVLIKTAMAAAGIVMKFNFIPTGQFYSTVQDPTKQGDLSRAGWGADWANASTVIYPLFVKEGGFDLSETWADPTYASFKADVLKTLAMTDRAQQSASWKKLAQYAMDQYWVIGMIFSKGQEVWGSKVGGAYFWGPQGTLGFGQLYVKA